MLDKLVLHLTLFWSVSATSQNCLHPFQQDPEMHFDYSCCSTVLEWTRISSDDCPKDINTVQIQFINGSAENLTRTSDKLFHFAINISGICLAYDNCFARIRVNYNDSSWSEYSDWIGLSSDYEVFEGIIVIILFKFYLPFLVMFYRFSACVANSSEVCIPLQSCDGNTAPHFFVDNEQIMLGSDNLSINQGNVCFRNSREGAYYVIRCHESRNFTNRGFSSHAGVFIIQQMLQIKRKSNKKGM